MSVVCNLAQQLKKREINPSYLPDEVLESERMVSREQQKTIDEQKNRDKTERIERPIKEQPQNWSNDIAELENYFAILKCRPKTVKLNQCSTIMDCSLFIENHFAAVKGNNGKPIYLPYLNRLQELKQVLTINSK